jgi:hypothetical protein
MTVNTSVLAQVAALQGMETTALKKMWRDLFDTAPPPYNRRFLVNRLSYRLQELAFGGLSKETVERLEAMAGDGAPDERNRGRGRAAERPVVGTRLVREWNGVEHHVTVQADCFEWQGKKYKSLSAVARAITGTRWNGRLFFGLRKHGSGK